MPTVGIDPANPTIERPETTALDRAATGMSLKNTYCCNYNLGGSKKSM
jgi:hypothetical protein